MDVSRDNGCQMPRILCQCICLFVGFSALLPLFAGDSPLAELGVRVPDGFEVTEYAGDDLAHDIYSMTID